MDQRMPTESEARAFKTHVLQSAASWLRDKSVLDEKRFHVEIDVAHTANASETLQEYFGRDTGDEAK